MPERWRETTLGAVVQHSRGTIKTGPFGTALKAAEYTEHGAPVISTGEVGYGRLKLHERTPRLGGTALARLSDYVLVRGDIVFSRKGSIDRSAWISDAEDGYFLGSDALRVRLGTSHYDSRFIAYSALSPTSRKWLVQHSSGTTMPSMNQEVLGRLPIRVPPLAEQRRIAGVLGAFDDLIDTNRILVRRLVKQTDYIADLLSADADGVPTTFGAVTDVGGGGTPSTKEPAFWNGDIPWATPTDLTALPSPYIRATSRSITQAGLSACASSLYPVGSILMTSRATIGSFALAQIPVAVNQGFIVVTPRQEEDRYFLFHEMRRRLDDFVSNANGSTFLELSRGRFKTMDLSWPSLETRRTISEAVQPLHHAANELEIEVANLTKVRDELLPLMMSGRITVDEAWESL